MRVNFSKRNLDGVHPRQRLTLKSSALLATRNFNRGRLLEHVTPIALTGPNAFQ